MKYTVYFGDATIVMEGEPHEIMQVLEYLVSANNKENEGDNGYFKEFLASICNFNA